MTLRIEWVDDQEIHPINDQMLKEIGNALNFAAQLEGIENKEVVVSFVDDEVIQQLNLDFRNINSPTDVLSFPNGEDELDAIIYDEEEAPDAQMLGDIIISVSTAIVQSEEYGHTLLRELGFLAVHGFLHLVGYDHQDASSEQVMIKKQEHVLQHVGLVRQ